MTIGYVRRSWLSATALGAVACLTFACGRGTTTSEAGSDFESAADEQEPPAMTERTPKNPADDRAAAKLPATEEEWRRTLTPEQYAILREKGTEAAFTGKYWNTKTDGVYRCAGCGELLFTSDTKFDSGCGWPSFFAPADEAVIDEHVDLSHFMVRTEVTCKRCGGHLGHVFNDGPPAAGGLRYCINSASLTLEPEQPAEDQRSPAPAPDEPR